MKDVLIAKKDEEINRLKRQLELNRLSKRPAEYKADYKPFAKKRK